MFLCSFMSLYISSLNSGSNGNCYYVGDRKDAVLVDAGISCREIENRMKRSGLSIHKVRAVFISHEHSDHIRGIEVLSKKYDLPVYISNATLQSSRLTLDAPVIPIKPYDPVTIGDLRVIPFPKLHDAADPYSFIVENSSVKVGVFTDIGKPCDHVIKSFRECHAAFLEANYDTELLEKGSYPVYLKRRIRSGHGHLSNDQALSLFKKHKSEFLSHLILSHLSKENNCSILVNDLFTQHAGNTKVVVASRDRESDVYQIAARSKKVGQLDIFSFLAQG